jgi:hypothetical protein
MTVPQDTYQFVQLTQYQHLVVPEDKIVSIQVVDDTINTAVAGNHLHSLALVGTLQGQLISGGLGLEKSDAEPARLEDTDNMLDNVGSLATTLTSRHVGLKRSVRALGLRSDMHSEVVRSVRALLGTIGSTARSRDNTIGREAAWREQISIDTGIRILGGRIDVG